MRLVPLISGKAVGNKGPAGSPRLQVYPANAAYYFDDFFNSTIAPANFSVGTVATPDTITHLAPFGGPAWVGFENNGTTGSVGTAVGTTGNGILTIAPGATSGNTFQVTNGYRTAASAGLVRMDKDWTLAVSMAISAVTTVRGGFALGISSLTVGSDWITDPATSFTGVGGLAIYMDSAVASGAMQARWYEPSSTDDDTLTLNTPVGSTYYKYEIAFNATSKVFTFYVDGVSYGSISTPNVSAANYWASFGIQTNAAATRILTADYMLLAVGQSAPR